MTAQPLAITHRLDEALFAAMLDGLQEAVWLLDAQTLQVLHANAESVVLTGYEAQAALGLHVDVLCDTLVQKTFWQDSSNWRYGARFLSQILRSDGLPCAVEMSVRWLDTSPAMLLLSMLDRSQQLAHEVELETLLAETRATLESAADGILVCDLKGGIRAFNHRFAQLWQLPSELLTQRDDTAIFTFLESQIISSGSEFTLLQDAPDLSAPETTEVLQLRQGRVIERRSVPQLSRGVAIGRIYSFRDITAESLAASEQRLAARVFESSLDGIFIADEKGCIVQINPAGRQLLQEAHVLGRSACELFESDDGDAMDLLALAQARWELGGFWEGNLWLRADGERPRCAVWLSWVALRDGYGCVVQSIGFIRDMTQQHSAQKKIEELAFHDALTGLPNRLSLTRYVQAAIAQAQRTNESFSILFLDLDRFKIINDSLGHDFGDRVLRLVVERLGGLLRPSDMLCRLGGDEFVLYLHGCSGEGAAKVAERILDSMRQPFMLDGLGFSVQCSIGAAQFPTDGLTLDELIRQADIAMYRVKERGRGNFSFYQPQMSTGLLSRMKLEHAMRQALDRGHMAVYFQPQVHIQSQRIVAAEALLRWTDPDLGVVSPAVFIPLAEESGYVVALDAWVLEQSLKEAAHWLAMGTPVKVSVNVSALEFRQPDFVERLVEVLTASTLPPQWLELELTESILLQDVQEMSMRVHQIAELGVGLVIDDFGTGYSNLSYLKKLPISKIKIDQSFVRGLPHEAEDKAIVGAIISMGQALGLETVAEGVETQQQCASIAQMRGDYYQGYLCSPAVPAPQFRECLLQQSVQAGGWPLPADSGSISPLVRSHIVD